MAYEDWMPEFQDTWQNMPIDWGEVTDSQLELGEYMFEEGFMKYHGEATPEDIKFARDEFFRVMDIDPVQFDWSGWREAMGYE